MITAATMQKQIVITRISLAACCLFSPKRLATRAEIATFAAMNSASPGNFGCVVRPTAATALAPSVLTIKVSTIPASAIKKDSQTAGHASRIASFVREPCVCSVSISMLPITFSWIFPVSDSHNALLYS